jgi:hypothetical protein
MATIEAECRDALFRAGQLKYQAHLADRELADVMAKIYALNTEAFAMNQAKAAAQAELAAEAAQAAGAPAVDGGANVEG